MARLSNFVRKHDDSGNPDPPALECRPVRRDEIDRALKLLLAGAAGLASDEQVLDFLSFSLHRGVDVNATWVAVRRGVVEWALAPVVSPGRTMLLLTPMVLLPHTPAASVNTLSQAVCRHYSEHDIQLAQLLLDPQERAVRDAYVQAGFTELAELIYLHRAIKSGPFEVALPAGFSVHTYSPELEASFQKAIIASYERSLDCPGLNGVRSARDVFDGHKAAGEFDPSLWFLLLEGDQERGVLLLNRSIHSDAVELVYLGLVPAARGRALGDAMMRLAVSSIARAGGTEITLAVDSRNAPALSLYWRHGLKRLTTRTAMIRDLRKLEPRPAPMTASLLNSASPIDPQVR